MTPPPSQNLSSSLVGRPPSRPGPFRKRLKQNLSPTLWSLLLPLALALPAHASPFSVAAARDSFSDAPAIRLDFTIPPDHHLYSSFSVTDPASGAPLAPLSVPPPDAQDPATTQPSYSRSFSAFYSPPPADSLRVAYQGCSQTLCYMPETRTLSLSPSPASASLPPSPLPPSASASASPSPRRLIGYADVPTFLAFLDLSAPPPPSPSLWKLFLDDPTQFHRLHGLLPVLLLILLGGILLNLTPCVLPLIPINLVLIGASGTDATKGARFAHGLLYGLGMALAYGALGLAVVLSGSIFGALHSSPLFTGAIALLFLALALAMFDLWHLDFSRFRKTSPLAARARLPAVLAMGALSALLAGACVAPVLIAVLALSSALHAQGVPGALALPFLLGLGMALPWPLAATGLLLLPKPGPWMNHLKKAFGLLILLLALSYARTTLSSLRSPSPTSTDPLPSAPSHSPDSPFRRFDFSTDPPEAFSALLAEAAASGKPLLLDFGAHWCKVCSLMDATTLRDPQVVEKLNDVFPIQILADDPNQPPARDLLAPFSLQGYPTFLLSPPP